MGSAKKKTLIIGATTKPERYAYRAAMSLTEYGHPIVLLGRREGVVAGENIHTKAEPFEDIDTVTLYLGAQNQVEYYQYIVALNPKRVIFNPGAENADLCKLLEKHGIECLNACTLVMLSIGNY